MGKASRFFKSLLGFKTTDSPPSRSDPKKPLKRRWSFVTPRQCNSRPSRHRNTSKSIDVTSIQHHHHQHHNQQQKKHGFDENEDSSKRAIAFAAATAAVVDAAVATAHAAAEVVRMTSGYGGREQVAAIKIQSCFRAYLARRALRALKALVRLQAVVRGHILRKQTADMMRRLQALIRAQARARALRSQIIDHSTTKPSLYHHFHHHGPPTPENFEHVPHTKKHHSSISKRNISKSYARGLERAFHDGSTDHEHDKIVEVDTVEPHVTFNNGRKLSLPDQICFGYSQSLTTSKGSTFQPTSSSQVSTPIKSDGSRSCFSGYSDHPNYMAYTESSRAKLRSLSAPRLRSQLEVPSGAKRDSGYKHVSSTQQAPSMRDSFAKKAYPGSGRLDRLGMPVHDTVVSEFYDSYWN